MVYYSQMAMELEEAFKTVDGVVFDFGGVISY